ncbi:DUF885 domain-containing protein [Qipengyuania flava]|uniref:DUF885 domain-containing protein n=1 Tax=Qipengyuania flava TaxID=192812 RepID=UPI001C571682|nr:DUF885 domain-containing protein [Qipengyuania flava]MBW3169544.1 DUF885 domain-containing protein [Qipengyuania flava]MBY5966782.1 DUF885 domain-containing protein [Qipengyuania flava]MBY6013106.1 DUF885 domain-containing protein [Qipengyuania flava]MBY6027548.1 DUF885 domain-containing protein [Qipengyuania flava]
MTVTFTRLASALAMATALAAAPAAGAQDHSGHAAQVSAAEQASHRLHALFERSEAEMLDRNPVAAFFRGDFSDADRIGDYSPASYAADRAAAEEYLAELATIDRESLGETDRIAYDVFEYTQQRTLAQTAPDVLPTVLALPIDHFRGLHVFYPRLSARGALMPFDTVEDYRNNFARHREFAQIVDQAIERFRAGAAQGITLPRMSVELMIEQLDLQTGTAVEKSPYWAPVANFPDSFTATERERLLGEHRAVLAGTLMPALQKLRDFLASEYLEQSRTSIAATDNPGGDAYYSYRIEENTTLPLTAQQIHETGLAEVARINAAIDAAEAEADGRTGETYTSKADLQAAWYEVAEQVDPLMDRVFLRQPKTELRIEPYEPYREKFSLAASYSAGKADGTRPGTFYFSGYNVAERELGTSISLYMHEGNPGHHFQSMFAIENEELPEFMRYGGFTAFSEGWGLYAESLGYELGLYDDPVERLKALEGGEMLRAVRLVVDTGMHALGWSREQAIEYMVANGAARDFAESESARYIVMPAQALAYKTGELKIKQLRARAEAALGEDFDVRAFHEQVLNTGDIPLPVLEAKIDAWIAGGGQ